MPLPLVSSPDSENFNGAGSFVFFWFVSFDDGDERLLIIVKVTLHKAVLYTVLSCHTACLGACFWYSNGILPPVNPTNLISILLVV